MSSTAAINLSDIPAPAIIEAVTFEELLKKKIEIIKTIRPGWEPAESDDFSVIAESWAYDDLHHRIRFNNAVKAMLLPYSTESDLDNLAVMYGVTRLAGTRPKAKYTFSLTDSFKYSQIIPGGTALISADGKHTATVCEDIVFAPDTTETTGLVELNACTEASAVKTEIFVTPIPYVKATAKYREDFHNGASVESDEEFRERILLSLYSFSTAGSKESYIYWTRSADARIRDVSVGSTEKGTVDIHVLADTYDEALWDACRKAVTDAKRRPLTDKVIFHEAEAVTVDITAEIRLPDLSMAESMREAQRKTLSGMTFKLGEDLSLSRIYATLHTGGVLSVALECPETDITANHNQAVQIGNINLNYI